MVRSGSNHDLLAFAPTPPLAPSGGAAPGSAGLQPACRASPRSACWLSHGRIARASDPRLPRDAGCGVRHGPLARAGRRDGEDGRSGRTRRMCSAQLRRLRRRRSWRGRFWRVPRALRGRRSGASAGAAAGSAPGFSSSLPGSSCLVRRTLLQPRSRSAQAPDLRLTPGRGVRRRAVRCRGRVACGRAAAGSFGCPPEVSY